MRIQAHADRSSFEGVDWALGPTVWFSRNYNGAPCWGVGFHLGPILFWIGSSPQ